MAAPLRRRGRQSSVVVSLQRTPPDQGGQTLIQPVSVDLAAVALAQPVRDLLRMTRR
jgi:hypothetical protein